MLILEYSTTSRICAVPQTRSQHAKQTALRQIFDLVIIFFHYTMSQIKNLTVLQRRNKLT